MSIEPREPHPTPKHAITARLREVIESRGLTAHGASVLSGLDPRSIDRFLKGQRGLTGESIDRLADALNLRLIEVEIKARKKPGKTR